MTTKKHVLILHEKIKDRFIHTYSTGIQRLKFLRTPQQTKKSDFLKLKKDARSISEIMNHKIFTQLTLLMSLSLLLVGCGENDKETRVSTPPPAPPSVDLLTAASKGDLDSVNQHIAAGTDLNQKDPKPTGKGDNALGLAALFGHTSVSKALMDAGADLNAKNKDGSTPLHIAAFLCRTEIVQLLIEKGADRNIKNNTGATALESVQAPWIAVKGIYDLLNAFLFTPMQIPLDYDRIQETRPKIVQLIQQ